MAMIYLGNSRYFDTDDLSNSKFNEFCKHRDNLIKYYNKRKDKNTIKKASLLGIDIKELISDAENFIAINLLGQYVSWKDYGDALVSRDVAIACSAIANGMEE